MKNSILLLISVVYFAANSFAVTVPAAVQKAFDQKFPQATEVKWDKENSSEYEANFKINGVSASANFSDKGIWLETETEIPVAQLPEAVTSAIKKQFPQSVITGADKIENSKNETHFEADLKTGSKTKEVVFNADGTVIK